MTVALSRRRITSYVLPDAAPTDAAATLADLAPGHSAMIVDICDEANPSMARRLFDLGFAPGVEVEVVRRAPLADPVVFRLAGYDIALRRAQARCIRVAATS